MIGGGNVVGESVSRGPLGGNVEVSGPGGGGY